MNLVPWRRKALSPRAQGVASLIDQFFDEPMLDRLPDVFRGTRFPAIDITEDEKSFSVAAELPGLEEKDIDVQILGNQLQISGERKFEEETKEKEFHRVESQYGSFSRTVSLPTGLRTDAADAVYKKGILRITFPKVEPTPTSKVKVKAE